MIPYTSDLHTHVDMLDEQHEEMIKRINAVEAIRDESISREEAERILNFLGEYIIKHFGDEEELQIKTGYPHYDWHHEMHQWYIAEFHKLKEEYLQNGPSEHFTHLLNHSIVNWILKHIEHVDTTLAKYVHDHNAATHGGR